jgi:predicted CoA-binding protein
MRPLQLIHEFLDQHRFAMVGVSRNPKDFSRALFREFLQRGYDVLPVNPGAEEIEGRKCYVTVDDIQPHVSTALLMTPSTMARNVVEQCANAGITLVWVYGIAGEKEVDPTIIPYCKEHGIQIVPGYCPFMFLSDTAFFHRLHGWAWKILKLYPN